MSLICPTEMVVRAIRVAPQDLVFVRHVLEASEGLGFVVGHSGGDVLIVGHVSCERELDQFLLDMTREVELRFENSPGHQEAYDVAR